jgi:hypothetical protein
VKEERERGGREREERGRASERGRKTNNKSGVWQNSIIKVKLNDTLLLLPLLGWMDKWTLLPLQHFQLLSLNHSVIHLLALSVTITQALPVSICIFSIPVSIPIPLGLTSDPGHMGGVGPTEPVGRHTVVEAESIEAHLEGTQVQVPVRARGVGGRVRLKHNNMDQYMATLLELNSWRRNREREGGGGRDRVREI